MSNWILHYPDAYEERLEDRAVVEGYTGEIDWNFEPATEYIPPEQEVEL